VVKCKATNELIGKIPQTTQQEMETAVNSCQRAFKTWSKTTPLHRQQVMFKLQQLIKENMVCLFLLLSDK
jgi:malonate-semialdehyde dehydrogenase (acetylating)/methylmalonate-semialdehyde dehydrogenase